MAGIGFELKKMFNKKGILATTKAYGYATIICTGPVLLGIALLIGIRVIAHYASASKFDVEILNSMLTYTLLTSLIITNVFSYITTRFTADCIYEKKKYKVFSSFIGSISIMLILGEIPYFLFLFLSDLELPYILLNLLFLSELIIVWTEMNYLTAIKDYKGLFMAFLTSIMITFILGIILLLMHINVITALYLAVITGYGVMVIWYFILLKRYFPFSNISSLTFLEWIDKYPQLFWLGIILSVGFFGHIIIMWFSPLQIHIYKPYYGAPSYDIPALAAFLSTLVTVVNFITSVEVNFYPKYRTCFSLFNDGGSYTDIIQAEEEMASTLRMELEYLFARQLFVTVVFIIVGSFLLPRLNIGFNETSTGVFQILCVGYAFYGLANSVMLMQLYFADNKGALIDAIVFAISSCALTVLFLYFDPALWGLGFTIGSLLFLIVALVQLYYYIVNINYHILSTQPLVFEEKIGFFTKIARRRYF